MRPLKPDFISRKLADLLTRGKIADEEVCRAISDYLSDVCDRKLTQPILDQNDLSTFYPPRLISALKDQKLMIFFGAGLSIPCGIPGWNRMLEKYFDLDRAILEDTDLESDPLTVAELASQHIGHENLQNTLRFVSQNNKKYSTNHVLLSALRAPLYMTTNYDSLFEESWRDINGKDIPTIVNDADITRHDVQQALANNESVLLKIHGSADRLDEFLILTRRDYRRHYRVNNKFFESIREFLSLNKVLFLGFSHKDPEVSRLVDDVIYDFEQQQGPFRDPSISPHFFSMQFNMRSHTPEVFAARGFVTLQSPVVQATPDNVRAQGLGVALSDLMTRKVHPTNPSADIYDDLIRANEELSSELADALKIIKGMHATAKDVLNGKSTSTGWIKNLCTDLGEFASQGVYLVDEQGDVLDFDTPSGIAKRARNVPSFKTRPYFLQAKSFREEFVSDSVGSVFNGQSTFFICSPVLEGDHFLGLLFSACQVGQWQKPIEIAKRFWKQGQSLILVDSNGVCLIPPNNEFQPYNATDLGASRTPKKKNHGYDFHQLLSISHRDRMVSRVGQSVVPLGLDDDVVNFSSSFIQFSVLSEVSLTRWKIAVSKSISKI